ncbi:MAG TPA: peptidase T, partial [Pirellulales bacterium]|nr:peptidase T [Pirellulales bacterium]
MSQPINHERMLERFVRYARVDTTAGDPAKGYPSSAGQLELGRMLVAELHAAGLLDAVQDEHGIVLATLAANVRNGAPTIAFNAHLDTSPETTGAGVQPQVWRDYDGRDIVLPGDPRQVIRVSSSPELPSLAGRTI